MKLRGNWIDGISAERAAQPEAARIIASQRAKQPSIHITLSSELGSLLKQGFASEVVVFVLDFALLAVGVP
jgi:hypothetical protein